jgi:hypothetical protein|uniref:Uncharacterized protein n=1 Tax=Myoviridae sp. ctlHW5 TaxID=2826691 RepID=A0A8S5N880_9CAUD|nr:MAG TPA: hypothetical protein [Myoviridae sp. ctlHW5]
MGTIEKQKTFRHCLLYYLDYKPLGYEHLQWLYFEDWCDIVNKTKQISKDVLDLKLNDHLINWYLQHWEVYVERDIEYYYGKALREGVFDRSDIELMIGLAAEHINHIYPKTILQLIEKSKKLKSTVNEKSIYGSTSA